MCGIAGALTTRPGQDLRGLVEDILAHQRPRGPDAEGVEVREGGGRRLVLGHNRLSVIDLSPDANQPMADAEGRRLIVYNGEIYNYLELRAELEAAGARFRTKGDTEVVLEAYRAWGAAAFDRFIGMFAFALHDAAAGELLLVRDRFGVKPLHYWTDGRAFVFASLGTPIARWAGLKPDLDYAARGLRLKYYEDETGASPYAGLRALEPSHWLSVRAEGGGLAFRKGRYYDLAARVAGLRERLAGENPAALGERLAGLLESATRLRLRADVPLGVSLSGGVDSSSVAALLARSHDRVRGYSFAHPDARESEGPLVARLAAATGVEVRYVWPTRREEVVDLFWRTMAAQDAPFPHVSVMAQHAVFRAARADGVVVLLGGQGGDEAFMGYRKFYLFRAQWILRERRLRELPGLLAALAPFAPAVARRAGLFWGERRRYAAAAGGMATGLRLPAPRVAESAGLAPGQAPWQRQVLDVTRFSLPTLLRYEDRNSMGNGVESRLPFMDQRVVEFGVALPEAVKLRDGFGKWLLREAVRGRVPDAIRLNRDKRGFDVDQGRWLGLGLGAELRSALRARAGAVAQYLPRGGTVDGLFADARLGTDPQAFKEAVTLLWLADRA